MLFLSLEQVSDSTGAEIGRIIKHWSGARECFGGVNDFRVQCKLTSREVQRVTDA